MCNGRRKEDGHVRVALSPNSMSQSSRPANFLPLQLSLSLCLSHTLTQPSVRHTQADLHTFAQAAILFTTNPPFPAAFCILHREASGVREYTSADPPPRTTSTNEEEGGAAKGRIAYSRHWGRPPVWLSYVLRRPDMKGEGGPGMRGRQLHMTA